MKVLLLALFLTASFSGFTKEGGNGGGVHVCGNKYELYDFFEGRDPRGHNIKLWKSEKRRSRDYYIEQANNHIKRDIPEVAEKVAATVKKILATPEKELFGDITIPVINDATISIIGDGCRYQQAANWDERFGKLFISKEIYGKLDSMNQAGLIIHEAIYKLSRETKVSTETSDLVREVVARIFSDEKLTEKDSEVISSQAARILGTKPMCEAARKQFATLDEITKGKMDPQYTDLNNKIVDYCLKWCLIPEERAYCEKKRQ
ncbi:MAG: hypothetical protein V4598_05770 [Bdellovibrionota bacterium]